jgi:hypothetical protein
MKKFLLLFLCVTGCNSVSQFRTPANSETVGISPNKIGLTHILCEDVFPMNHQIDSCKQWVKNNIHLNIFELTNKICRSYDLAGRQASCFKKAAEKIQIDQDFKYNSQLCKERNSYPTQVDCYVRIFSKYSTQFSNESSPENEGSVAN